MSVLVIAEHDRGDIAPSTLEAMAGARMLAAKLDCDVHAVVLGDPSGAVAGQLGAHGAAVVHTIDSDVLSDFGSEAYADGVCQLVAATSPKAVTANGTARGNEVLAQIAARLDLPFSANIVDAVPSDTIDGKHCVTVTRHQWGGTLLEDAELVADTLLMTYADHAFEPSEAPAAGTIQAFAAEIDPTFARSVIKDRTVTTAGVTLSTAPFVAGGGRGMGNPESFAMLEELAELLGGRVGCSRAVTNLGWRNHADQVGQTGTRIAPEVYLASGISGATQHWVGAMGSKNIIAINTDKEANLVTKAGHAVVADLHAVIPALIDEVKRRQGA